MSVAPDSSLAYQELQPDDIIASVESLGYLSDGRLLPLNSYENRVYRVGLEDQPQHPTDVALVVDHEHASTQGHALPHVVSGLEHEGAIAHPSPPPAGT